ncbi:hypothetical protein SPB21_03650 [Leptothoe sp. ISB3NOV94-8A]
MASYKVGVAGYCAQEFDHEDARNQLRQFIKNHPEHDLTIVSGLSDMGVLGIAYRLADEHGMWTVGIAAGKAKGADNLYPCDEVYFVGKNWGDESLFFLGKIDELVAYEGGEQTKREVALAKELGIKVTELSYGK